MDYLGDEAEDGALVIHVELAVLVEYVEIVRDELVGRPDGLLWAIAEFALGIEKEMRA
ncbi:MAG TPA: hypothetical protein VGL89_07660 [Candidatus Koribacter sp.]